MDIDIAGPTRATDALEWEAIKEACAVGARWYQMGDSSTPGVAAFKERFGAVQVDYDEFVSERVPLTRVDQMARAAVKRLVGFDEDATGPPA